MKAFWRLNILLIILILHSCEENTTNKHQEEYSVSQQVLWDVNTDEEDTTNYSDGSNDLIITKENSPYIHSNGKFVYRNLIIKKGGTLIFENYDQWIQILVRKNAQIDGTIILRNWKVGLGEVKETAPDGIELIHTYSEDNKGGKGGSKSWRYGRYGAHVTHGYGANGSTTYGGGGGSGYGLSSNYATDAKNYNGARATHNDGRYAKGGDGGNGAGKRSLNGGLLYLKVMKKMTSNGGEIIASGSRGLEGARGKDSKCINWRRSIIDCSYPGNGGGGGPGGDGGSIYLRVKRKKSLPKTYASGGPGGAGGRGGITLNYKSNTVKYRGDDGKDGDTGNSGIVSILPWKNAIDKSNWEKYSIQYTMIDSTWVEPDSSEFEVVEEIIEN